MAKVKYYAKENSSIGTHSFYAVTIDVVQAIAQVLGMTVDLIDPALQDLAPLRKLNTDK